MTLDHYTERDDTLIHQVRFVTRVQKIYVSCICRSRTGDHEKAGKLFQEPIGSTKNLAEARDLYNDPENHWAPFTNDDKAKW